MENLQKHIALHLERFSMFSLPRDISNDDKDRGSKDANINIEGSRDLDFEGSFEFASDGKADTENYDSDIEEYVIENELSSDGISEGSEVQHSTTDDDNGINSVHNEIPVGWEKHHYKYEATS
ncbi:hypothetical protein AA313_de0200400 [Arthrobotrys entomopaga]|nr:hypothetical protein AA313_de0200400 [Arthrobotrys entomopaga]